MCATRRVQISEWVPVSQMGKILSVSRSGAYWLISQGTLVTQRLGPNTILVSRDSIIAELRRRGATVEIAGNEIVITDPDEA
jgi:hypothetical protein